MMSDATTIPATLANGDESAAGALFPLVYARRRALASGCFRGQRPDQTLQPTALVHDAYLKLIAPKRCARKDRRHLPAVAATAMRQILSGHARRRMAAKRGGEGCQRVTLSDLATPHDESQVDRLPPDAALNKLAGLDARQARIVELRLFGGLTTAEEIAMFHGVSTRTIEKERRRVRAWLSAELSERECDGSPLSRRPQVAGLLLPGAQDGKHFPNATNSFSDPLMRILRVSRAQTRLLSFARKPSQVRASAVTCISARPIRPS